ncbi:ATP-dependent RNA helicase prh1 [Trichosporon asahii var. asahii CBS 2479]|uniref:RNA helicase n=1 Tax=Trichosporon asahii var. asahii (strain ATCC 90039 / CBS 2479 / JCM 2466 / KCTC 7840 / NBRC 103889/ NCYC 2677 / UAMH 7654) TaxID=1186058 RepID=J6F636_TRIAS|nr:ATP-dependent RNA helicase prh1 [Trichosporon asahii var. asahii CBS 2479]EJT52494.1 ATP-dependent RNA helicase prh1 [Trichosporon asahii var. asahii CBS 2479]
MSKQVNFHSDSEDEVPSKRPRVAEKVEDSTPKDKKSKKKNKKKQGKGKGAPVDLAAQAAELLKTRQSLPFYQDRANILDAILSNDTTVVVGETGCGKSTQLGQLLRREPRALEYFNGKHKGKDGEPSTHAPSIAITQPRRLPCISLATRVAAEMGVEVGKEVGYAVRFEDCSSFETKVRFLTEGVLMRELANADGREDKKKSKDDDDEQEAKGKGKANGKKAKKADAANGDEMAAGQDDKLNLLERYDVVVIDEAHERTLNTDFLLGSLKKIQRIRAERAAAGKGGPLKLVIMSATLDPAKFTNFFDHCPSLHVPGRMYDVDIQNVPTPVDDYIESASDAVISIHTRKPSPVGEVLIFMPGSDEIENTVALLRRKAADLGPDADQLQVLPLYSSLPPSAQAKIFAPLPPKTRRIVVATNVAETSLTIPGIAFVIDSGFKKEKEYIYRASGAIEHLRKQAISQASANQRKGRAGREMPGECLRLYTKDFFKKMKVFDTPEIQRCNLSSAILSLIAMNQNPFEFEYIDAPGRDSIVAAFRSLAGLGAIASPTEITPLGREMLKYPLDPEHGRILLAGFEFGCSAEIIDILSLIVSGPVFVERGSDGKESAAQARQKFIARDGDHLTGMNVLRAYLALKEQRAEELADGESSKKEEKGLASWCRDNAVNSKTLAAACKVRAQLRQLAVRHGQTITSCHSELAPISHALLQGLFMNTAVIQADGTYKQTVGSLQVKIHPSSVLAGKKVPAILYDELTITSAIYARNVSAFEQGWLAEVPWFQKAAGGSVARPVERKQV